MECECEIRYDIYRARWSGGVSAVYFPTARGSANEMRLEDPTLAVIYVYL